MNFCISANSLTKKYECKTTHSATPFLKVDTQYLDLTTKTTSGLNIKVKYNNQTYRPLQTATSTSSRSSQYISTSGYTGKRTTSKQITQTTGYSGTSKRNSTSGYSGVSKRNSTSGYSGRSTYTASRASTSGYQGSIFSVTTITGIAKISTATNFTRETCYKANSTATATNSGKTGTCASSKTARNSMIKSVTSSTSWKRTSTQTVTDTTWKAADHVRGHNVVLGNIATSSTNLLLSMFIMELYSGKFTRLASSNITIPRTRSSAYNTNSLRTSSAVGVLKSTTALTRTSAYKTSSTAIGAMSSTTALTRTSAYVTSSTAVGAMSSTTALTRTSSSSTVTNTTSSITNTILLSTTALTKTASRTSQYSTTTEI